MPTGTQIRAARVFAGIDAEELATLVGMTRISIQNLERGDTVPKPENLANIVNAFSNMGIEFTENEGVRRRPSGVEVLQGTTGFARFYEHVYEHLRQSGGSVCVSGVDESLFVKYRPPGDVHRTRMMALAKERKDFDMRILVKEGDRNFTARKYAKYKWQREEYFSPTPFYVFGDRLALISFAHEPAPLVIILQSASFADAYRRDFNLAWANAIDPTPIHKEKRSK